MDWYGRRVRGTLLGGALGDALGKPVEFLSLPQIRERYAPHGIAEPPDPALVTDDTQMTLFTAEGLIRASVRFRDRGICHPPSVVWHAYLRWLATQGRLGEDSRLALGLGDIEELDGWLVHVPALHAQRAPGTTCLSALASGRMGDARTPINNSKGCGGVMRAAPAGLCRRGDAAFELGRDVAAITHGHPAGYDAAGALAMLIAELAAGRSPAEAVTATQDGIARNSCDHSVRQALDRAVADARNAPADPDVLRALGAGWVAEEALAVSIYSALSYPRPNEVASALALAANHDGDSDSTAAITGNILGAAHGEEALPPAWLDRLEMRAEITRLADDFTAEFSDE